MYRKNFFLLLECNYVFYNIPTRKTPSLPLDQLVLSIHLYIWAHHPDRRIWLPAHTTHTTDHLHTTTTTDICALLLLDNFVEYYS